MDQLANNVQLEQILVLQQLLSHVSQDLLYLPEHVLAQSDKLLLQTDNLASVVLQTVLLVLQPLIVLLVTHHLPSKPVDHAQSTV